MEKDKMTGIDLESEDGFLKYAILSKEVKSGKYNVVYFPNEDSDGANGNDYSSIESLNGATVNLKHTDLEYRINWVKKPDGDSEGEITSIDFTMPGDEKWLEKIFDRMPYGLIKKNRTGIGATTLELKADRNSIIVVPTKALASSKS